MKVYSRGKTWTTDIADADSSGEEKDLFPSHKFIIRVGTSTQNFVQGGRYQIYLSTQNEEYIICGTRVFYIEVRPHLWEYDEPIKNPCAEIEMPMARGATVCGFSTNPHTLEGIRRGGWPNYNSDDVMDPMSYVMTAQDKKQKELEAKEKAAQLAKEYQATFIKKPTEAKNMKIETITFINDTAVSEIDDNDLIRAIARLEEEISDLLDIKTSSTKIEAKIAEKEELIVRLVEILDGR